MAQRSCHSYWSAVGLSPNGRPERQSNPGKGHCCEEGHRSSAQTRQPSELVGPAGPRRVAVGPLMLKSESQVDERRKIRPGPFSHDAARRRQADYEVRAHLQARDLVGQSGGVAGGESSAGKGVWRGSVTGSSETEGSTGCAGAWRLSSR